MLAEAPVKLEPLLCPDCGGAVALADQDTVPCPFCKTRVSLPAGHRDAVRAAAAASETRVAARRLYAELGSPPGRGLRFAAFLAGTWGRIVVSFVFVSAIVLAVLIFGAFAIGAFYRNNVFETSVGGHLLDWILIPAWAGGLLFITVLGVYGRRVALDRRKLQTALAAGPPARPGGPATCRECGGPLQIEETDLGVRCLYCGCDNLVTIRPEWLAAFRGGVAKGAREIEDVEREAAADRRRRRRSLLGHLALVCGLLGAIVGLAVWSTSGDDQSEKAFPPHWPLFVGDPRPVLRRMMNFTRRVAMPVGCASAPDYEPDDCAGDTCTTRLHVALRHDERIVLDNRSTAALEIAVSWHYFAAWPKTASGQFGHEIARFSLAPGGHREVPSDWSAWYQVRVTSPLNAPVGLCLQVAH